MADRVWIVDTDGELDVTTAGRLSDNIDEIAERHPSVVAVDLTHVSFIDSSGARVLIRAQMRLEAIGARLAVLRPHAMPRSFLLRTNLDRLIAIAESIEEAVERSALLQTDARRLSDEVRALREESRLRRAAGRCPSSSEGCR